MILHINNEIINKSEVFTDNNIGYFEDSYEYIYNNFYNNKDDIYSICSEFTKREESEVYDYNSILNDIKNNIMAYQYNYYSNMKEIFYNCVLLSTLPDIFKKSTDNVEDMSGIFGNCSSLLSLPDISEWNTNNVEDMSYMFLNRS